MDKFIGFDVDHKHTQACVIQAGQSHRYEEVANRRGPTSGVV